MGCFSFICKISKKNVQENEGVYLFLLKDGKVVEEQYGKYNVYGNVEGHEWETSWRDVFRLTWLANKSNGIAAIREEVYKGQIPTERSIEDPKQGTGRRKIKELKNEPYHKILK